MGNYEVNKMCAEYDKRCTYKGSHKATEKEIKDMLNESKKWNPFHT